VDRDRSTRPQYVEQLAHHAPAVIDMLEHVEGEHQVEA